MKILGVDDKAENLYLVETIVRAHGHEIVCARNGVEALEKLAVQNFDLIIADVLMPVMDGFQLCKTVKSDDRLKKIPFVFYTATYTTKQDEELGMALGASRFIIKPIEPAAFLAILEEVVREGESGKIPVSTIDFGDEDKMLSLYNERLVRKLEQKIQQLEDARRVLDKLIEEKNREITQRRLAEEEAARAAEQLRLIWDTSMDGMRLTNREGIILRANQALARLYGKPLDQLPGQLFTSLYGAEAESTLARYREGVDSRSLEEHFECELRRWDGEQIWVEGSNTSIELPTGPVVFSIIRDVTRRKLAEQARGALEEQLRQSQKLESVGQLAGGVAHDFNNLLTVINGYSDLTLSQLRTDDPLRERVEEIRKAGEQAAALTQRLLAFSRKQTMQPQVVDLNRVVGGTRPMLSRMVGEDVELLLQLHPEPTVIYADPHQLEQVLMNLVINSRDAMPRGGQLRLETSMVHLSPSEAQAHPGARSRHYAVLSVSDDGQGMTEEVRKHIFEPFYTTKEVGKGTGLGLAVVRGIVEQSGGFIEVHSHPGQGSTFRIYLPAVAAVPAEPERPAAATELRGNEAVLVVEDQAEVRKYVVDTLERYGYRVFQAGNAEDAQRVCERERGDLALLLTDVVMPQGSGKELADRIKERWPGIKVLFMSGYADDAIVTQGLQTFSSDFIQKPFTPQQLAIRIRDVLRGRSSSSSGGQPPGG